MKKKGYVATATVFMLVLKACGRTTRSAYALLLKGLYSHTVLQRKPANLQQQLLNQGSSKLLFDTRTPAEFEVSHLAGAELFNYDNPCISRLKDVPKDTPITLYCSIGYRSEKVGELLQQAGFSHVHHLYGGMFEWINQGFPVNDKAGKTNKVHAYSSTWGLWLQKGEKVYGK